jgi:UDP-N-acetylmuramyl tripeptide synthase
VMQKQNTKLREMSALWLGKILLAAVRVSGRGGTTLPGRAAGRVAPGLLPVLAGRVRSHNLLVTGTNGKTTTAYLVAGINRLAGRDVLHNRSGSNLLWGITTAFVESSSWLGGIAKDLGVLEADEGAFPAAVRELRPSGVVVTNIFRDQLDRYGEVDRIRDMIQAGLLEMRGGFAVLNADDPSVAGMRCHPETRVVTYGLDVIQSKIKEGLQSIIPGGFQALNADDPALAGMGNPGKEKQTWYYGLELPPEQSAFVDSTRDLKSCPRCSAALLYDRVFFAHLGHYRCPSCSFRRPAPDVKLVGKKTGPDGRILLDLESRGEAFRVSFPLIGTYNLYNLLAAVACTLALGVPGKVIAAAVAGATPSFGRMERFEIDGKHLVMALIKNPVGANEVLRTLMEQDKSISLLVAINDHDADGTDISWLWDAEFEQLNTIAEQLNSIVVSGIRAWDVAVRLKYAGFNPDKLAVVENLKAALSLSLENTAPGSTLFALPTYTAMLAMRRIINAMGIGRPYWEAK